MSAASGSANWAKDTEDSWNIPSSKRSEPWSDSWYSWGNKGKRNETEWNVDNMAVGTPKPDPDQNFERAEPYRQWRHPKHKDVPDLDQRPMTPERSWATPSAKPQEPLSLIHS